MQLVDRILGAKATDADADINELEEQIDWLIYDLYGLTYEEQIVVAGYFSDGLLDPHGECTGSGV